MPETLQRSSCASLSLSIRSIQIAVSAAARSFWQRVHQAATRRCNCICASPGVPRVRCKFFAELSTVEYSRARVNNLGVAKNRDTVENDTVAERAKLRRALLAFLSYNGISPARICRACRSRPSVGTVPAQPLPFPQFFPRGFVIFARSSVTDSIHLPRIHYFPRSFYGSAHRLAPAFSLQGAAIPVGFFLASVSSSMKVHPARIHHHRGSFFCGDRSLRSAAQFPLDVNKPPSRF